MKTEENPVADDGSHESRVRPARVLIDEMAKAYSQMERVWMDASTEERRAMIQQAKDAGTTNCWWAEYGAAQHILRRANFLA